MKNKSLILSAALILSLTGYAQEPEQVEAAPSKPKVAWRQETPHNKMVQGWSLDVGGQYTWMAFTTPPAFTGSTGGAIGKITYQELDAFFGQLRSIYNLGPLSSNKTTSSDNEWYTELALGYCYRVDCDWSLTPYVGIGLDFLNDFKQAYSTISSIGLHYRSSYALFGLEVKYSWDRFYMGLQVDGFDVFHQYLSIGGEPGAAWKMKQRLGVAGRAPIGFKLTKGFWLELSPYYRLMPIGSSRELGLPERTLNQWGAFLTFRCFL